MNRVWTMDFEPLREDLTLQFYVTYDLIFTYLLTYLLTYFTYLLTTSRYAVTFTNGRARLRVD